MCVNGADNVYGTNSDDGICCTVDIHNVGNVSVVVDLLIVVCANRIAPVDIVGVDRMRPKFQERQRRRLQLLL